MFAIPAIVVLIAYIFIKPQEYFTNLKSVPILYILMGLTVLLMVIDMRLRVVRPVAPPQLKWIVLFVVWALLTVLIRTPEAVPQTLLTLAITFVPYLVIACGVQRFPQLHVMAATYLALTLFLAVIGVHQNYQPLECLSFQGANNDVRPRDPTGTLADGTPCSNRQDCLDNNPEPGVTYFCERRGLLGTSTIGGGRVRYAGTLKDPNELAMVVSSGLPFGIGLFLVKRTPLRLVLLLSMIVLGLMSVKFSQSRGGLLVLLTVAATYSIQRFGKKAFIVLILLLLPAVAALRSDERGDAEESREERLMLQSMGLQYWRTYPLRGVGYGQWLQYHHQTTHNSYILLLAEVGLPGTTLWATIIYLSFKIPALALRRYRDRHAGHPARVWATASISSMAGLCVGIFFLSFYANVVPWLLVGFNGAMSHCIREHDRAWNVRVSAKELLLVTAGVLGFALTGSIILHWMGH